MKTLQLWIAELQWKYWIAQTKYYDAEAIEMEQLAAEAYLKADEIKERMLDLQYPET